MISANDASRVEKRLVTANEAAEKSLSAAFEQRVPLALMAIHCDLQALVTLLLAKEAPRG